MPRVDHTLPFNPLARIFSSFSVRTRIVVLALIPVGGFLANGFTYTAGEREVGRAFRTVTHSTVMSDASREFKSAISSMRLIVKDFTASPDDTLIARFEQAHALALKGLDALAESIDDNHAENIASLRKDVLGLRENFNNLIREQKTLGYDESSGLRRQLQVAGNAVERIINENMSGLAEADATRFMMALLAMRHFEADYRVNQSEVSRQQFQLTYKKFTDLFSGITVTPAMKNSLELCRHL